VLPKTDLPGGRGTAGEVGQAVLVQVQQDALRLLARLLLAHLGYIIRYGVRMENSTQHQ
jgi:hypothetical protein